MRMRKWWRIWKYALGSFSDERTKRYDNHVASIRTLIFVSYMVTNIAIVANAVRHWDNVRTVPSVDHTLDNCAILKK